MEEPDSWDGEPLTRGLLDSVAREVSRNAKPGSASFNYRMNAFIIRYFMGDAWFEEHMSLNARAESFLRPSFQGDNDVDPAYSVRVLELAELFLNLQFIRGFPKVLDHMSTKQIQSGLAEMHVGQCLTQKGVPFRYVADEVAEGTTVDIVFEAPDGSRALCEIKCKLETTEFSAGTIRNAFKEASRQIGSGNAGVMFVKVPIAWMEVEQAEGSLQAAIAVPPDFISLTKDQIRQYSRIKKVIFYVTHHAYNPERGLGVTHTTLEFDNPRNEPPWKGVLLDSYSPGNWISILALGRYWASGT